MQNLPKQLPNLLKNLPVVQGNNLFAPAYLFFFGVTGYYLMNIKLLDNTNFYQTSFLFACFIIAAKLFVYNFSFLQNTFNQNKHHAINLTFNILAIIVEIYIFYLIPKTLIESSVPNYTLQQLLLITVIWSIQVFVNRGLLVRNIVIFQICVYISGIIVIGLFNQFLLNNFYLTVRLFQLLAGIAIFTEILMLLQVNRVFIDKVKAGSK